MENIHILSPNAWQMTRAKDTLVLALGLPSSEYAWPRSTRSPSHKHSSSALPLPSEVAQEGPPRAEGKGHLYLFWLGALALASGPPAAGSHREMRSE